MANLKVLFVCIENSCRSQMAQGFSRHWGAGLLEAQSAGSRPSGKINETAIAVMAEKGIDIKDQSSKAIGDLPATTWDIIVTMGCGDSCPALPAKKRFDWNIRDPKNLSIDEFRQVRDEIEAQVLKLIAGK